MTDNPTVPATVITTPVNRAARPMPRETDNDLRAGPVQIFFDIPFAIEACSSLAADIARDAIPVDCIVPVSRDAEPFARFIVDFFPGATIEGSITGVSRGACCLLLEAWCTPASELPALVRLAIERVARPVTAAIILGEDVARVPDYHALGVARQVVPRFPWHP